MVVEVLASDLQSKHYTVRSPEHHKTHMTVRQHGSPVPAPAQPIVEAELAIDAFAASSINIRLLDRPNCFWRRLELVLEGRDEGFNFCHVFKLPRKLTGR